MVYHLIIIALKGSFWVIVEKVKKSKVLAKIVPTILGIDHAITPKRRKRE